MKKNHKREVLLARIVFAAFLVVVAGVIALVVTLISSHMREPSQQAVVDTETQKVDTEIMSIVVPETETEDEPVSEIVIQNPSNWTTAKVNFRKEASTSADIIKLLEQGTEVEVLSASEGWANVQYEGQTGYISSDYLTDVDPDGSSPEEQDEE